MPETTWTLTLRDRAAANAKRVHREVEGLTTALRALSAVAPSAQAALSRVAPAGTAGQIRGATAAIKQQTAALREQARVTGAGARAPSGRTRSGGASRAPGLSGRTRVDGLVAPDGATRREGMFTPRQAERLRAMGDANQRRWDGDRRRRDASGSRSRLRDQQRENRESQNYYRGVFRGQQSAAAWGRQQNARAAAQNARTAAQTSRAQSRVQSQARRAMAERAEHNSAVLGQAMGMLGMLGGIAAGVVGTVLSIGQAFLGVAAQIGMATLRLIAFREGALATLATLARTNGEGLRPGETPDQNSRRVRAQRQQQAGSDFNWAQDFARRTPLNMTQVVELQTQAAAAGYQGRDARDMTRAAADAGALHPNDAGTASRFMVQMGQLRNSAVARSADYRPAAMAAGVNESAAARRAATSAGIRQRAGESETAYQGRVRKAQSGGRISGRQMHDAILAEQRAMLGGGPSGSFATSQAGSMSATLSNLDEGFAAFITTIQGIENLPGVVALKGVLSQIADTLAGATNNGKRLQAFFAGFLDQTAGLVAGAFGPGGFDGALGRVLDIAKEVWPVLRQIFTAFSGPFVAQLQTRLGPLVGQLGDQGLVGTLHLLVPYAAAFGSWLGRLVGFAIRASIAMGEFIAVAARITETFGFVMDAFLAAPSALIGIVQGLFTGIGTAMTAGIVDGVRAGGGAVYAELAAVAGGAVDSVKSVLGIHSPSRVFADEVGWQIPAGIAQGARQGAGALDGAMAGLVPVPGVGGLGGLGGGSVSVVVQMTATGDPQADGETAGQAALDVILRGLEPFAFAAG